MTQVKQSRKRASYSLPKAEALPRPGEEAGVFQRYPWLGGVALVAMVIAVYWRACAGEFVWDDDANVTKNAPLRSLAGLKEIWLKPGATQQFYPLTHTSFWLDFHVWGLNPFPYHAENILLHGLSTVLLWMLLRRLAVPGACLGAALFALHPVGVESVAWITERKNTLAGVFFLASLLAAAKFWLPEVSAKQKFGPWRFYALALGFYLCALWSKTATIGLPAVILLLVWWKRRTWTWLNVGLLTPFAVVGVGMGLITMWVEKHGLGATGKDWEFSAATRVWLAGKTLWFYLGKLAWPYPLMFIYPRWTPPVGSLLAWWPVAALAAGIIFLWWKRNDWGRPVLFTVGYFVVMLFPVLGFFNAYFFRYSFVCDHFQYLASMGPLALAGAGISVAVERIRNRAAWVAPGIILAALGFLTWQQSGIFRDRETLWRDTVANNPNAWMAHNNLGSLLLQRGQLEEAITHFRTALEIKPDNPESWNNLGGIFLRAGDVKNATTEFKRALDLKPDYAAARANLGAALVEAGKLSEGITNYEIALQLAPDDLAAHVNIGDALFRQGRSEAAIEHYQRAIAIARSSGRAQLAEQLEAELKRQKPNP